LYAKADSSHRQDYIGLTGYHAGVVDNGSRHFPPPSLLNLRRVNPVVNRMTPVDAAAVSGADMVNALPKLRILGQFLKSFDQPVVISLLSG
jgi:hypothetical protein